MKKTLTINLGGTVYNIDEDAYVLLDNYLNNLRYHFRKQEGADEIVRDIETRIAELFNECIRDGKQVITIEIVESVIARMGKPEDLNDEADEEQEKKDTDKNISRRLFRNPDDRILGGVISGISAYFGWDPTWVRIILIVFGCFGHGLILAYLIAWIVIPMAQTATEKLQMRGEPINVTNIGKTVTNGFERANEFAHSDKPRSFLHRLGNAFVAVIGFLLKLFLILVAICCAPALLVGLIVLFALLMAATGILVSIPAAFYNTLPYIDWNLIGNSPTIAITIAVCGLLAIGIPVVGLLQLILQGFGKWKPMSTSTKIILILLWFIAMAVGIIFLLQAPFFEYSYFPALFT